MDDREPRRQPLDHDGFDARQQREERRQQGAADNRDERGGGDRGTEDRPAASRALTERERRERWPLG
jgi:hypothetical protein